MTTIQAAVELRGVGKRFGDFVALRDIDLTIDAGEFFSVLGPSGCGKSTMLRLIAGLEFADSGTLRIDGRNMSDVPAYRRPCNMVFQNYAIFPHLSVQDNVAYGLRNLKLSRSERDRRIQDKLKAVQMSGMEGRKSNQLSGGQRQRVALARALVRHPKVLLLDEPLGALDKNLREQMQQELRELQQSVGITFVLVTHDQEEALSMSDRIAVMSDGRVLQVAEPLEIYEQPICSHVANFIGDMNFMAAVTDDMRGSSRVCVQVDGFGQLEFDSRLDGEGVGRVHQVAIRPEKLRLSKGRTDAEVCVHGTVINSSYWGDQSQIQVSVDGCDSPITVAAHNLSESDGRLPTRGDGVWLSASRDAFLRFSE
jgi:spermidine/putrescine transport system ATP-binding protein/putrescine transport system ATP-binding protein